MNKKTAIIYASRHHGNTYKLVKAIADQYPVDLIDATKERSVNLSNYDLIGFASGIDFGKFYETVEIFAKENLPLEKKVFFLYTCAQIRKGFTDSMKEIVAQKKAVVLGEYGCKGFNTYGPWKVIGGMNKNHPDEDEIHQAVDFFSGCMEEAE